MEQTRKTVKIKKYANRRLYNTDTSTYVTLEDLAEMVRGQQDFEVVDAKSGEDLTHSVLTQIILEQESRGENLLPINFLRQLIRFYGDSVGRLVPSYLDYSLSSLTRDQEKYRAQFSEGFGQSAIDALQDQARKNMVVFEKAVSMMLAPFSGAGVSGASATAKAEMGKPEMGKAETAKNGRSDAPRAKAGDDAVEGVELAELRAQLKAMQRQLDKLSRE